MSDAGWRVWMARLDRTVTVAHPTQARGVESHSGTPARLDLLFKELSAANRFRNVVQE